MNSANGSAFRSAISRGSPICTNMCLEEVNFISPRQAGERTGCPRKRLLPPNQASASWRNPELSLRSVNSRSLCSMTTGTWKRSLLMPGLAGLTSVGPGIASSRT